MSLKLKITFDQNRVGQVDQIGGHETEKSCEDNDIEENMQTFKAATDLKRKHPYRQTDIAYTSEKVFASHREATQYVESMGLWKFERNRPTKMGSKGFYHCKMSDECKAKIYLLSDPTSSRVVLYQNNVEHDHSNYQQLNKKQILMASEIKITNEIDKEENLPVEIVNDDDFEDSLVDLFEEDLEKKTNIDDLTTEACSDCFENNNQTTNETTLNRIEPVYTPEKDFESRNLANEYLETVTPGMWKFERTRPTKMGSKCFYKCRLSENCKSKVFILSQENTKKVVIFKNNIEHIHPIPSQLLMKKSLNGCFSVRNGLNGENNTDNSLGPLTQIDENSNEFFDEDNDESPKFGLNNNQTNRFELIYTAEESFENRHLANQFIDSLKIWKFQRTRPTKKGNKCFYACKLSRDCKSKIYVLSTTDSESVTIFRNNHIHDHTQSSSRKPLLNSNFPIININKPISNQQNSASKIEPNIDELDGSLKEKYDNEIELFSNNLNSFKNNTGARLDFNYFAVQTFPNRFLATKYIESIGTWKFERTRSTKMGSKGFYHCKVADSCKSKIYILSEPEVEQVTLYRNNVEHNHVNNSNKNSNFNSNDIINSFKYLIDDKNLNDDKYEENLMDEYGSFSDNINSDENELKINLDENHNESEDTFTNIKNEEDNLDFLENEEDNSNNDGDFSEENKYFDNTEINQDNQSEVMERDLFEEENSENSFPFNQVLTYNTEENREEYEENEDSYDNVTSIQEENSKNKGCYRENPIYVAEKSFDCKKDANQFIESLNIWKFDRLRDSKTGIKGFYQCKISDFCKAKIYLLYHPDSEKVTLYKNNLEHEHTIKKIKKWGLTSLTKKLIDEAYLSGNTKPMSCLYKVRSLINAKTDKLKMGKLNGSDVTHLQNELDQLEIPPMTVLKNYINNTLKPKLNGQKESLTPEENDDFQQICNLSKRILFLEQTNKKLQDELEKEREKSQEISLQLEAAKNVLENSKLPKDYLVNLNGSNELLLKKQQVIIETLQKKIEELELSILVSLEKEKNIKNSTNINIPVLKDKTDGIIL